MTLAMQTRSASDSQRGLLRRSSQNSTSSPSSPVVEAVDFCRSKPRLVELEKQLYHLANGRGNLQLAMNTCQSLLSDFDSVNGIFNVFCSCSWVDRYCEPVISQLFYELVSSQHAGSNGTLLLTELETACEELLKVLTHLGTPNTLQFNVVSLLYNLSRLSSLPSSHQEAVQSYLEEIARALWPYSKPSAPNLWVNEAFCDAQCDILKACGKVLEEKCPVNTERTFQMIIGKLVSGDISKYSRFRLLEIRELRSSGWKVSAATMNYYKESYLKFINQSRKDKLLNEVSPSPMNECKMANPLGESKNQTNIKPVTVVRITESELWKSCEDMQEELLTQEVIAEEKTAVVDDKSCLLVDCTDLQAKLKICDEVVRDKEPSNVSYSKVNPFLCRTDLENAQQPGNSDEDGGGAGVTTSKENEEIKHSNNQISSQDFTDDDLGRASSPSNSDGSDEVFADTSRPASTEINAVHKNKVLPALHRGEFKKPRRPFKSDSSVISGSESVEARTALSLDTKESRCNSKLTLARSQSEVTTAFEYKNISCGLATETEPVVVPVLNDIDEDSKVVSNESKVVEEQDHNTGNVMESWRARKLPGTDSSWPWGDQIGERSVRQNWRERKLPVDSDSQEHKNGPVSVVQNWRERPSIDLKEAEGNHSNDAISNENLRERKLSFSTVDSDSQERKNGPSSVIQNWRERSSVDLKESENNHSNNASSENWRERNSDHLGDFWNKGSHHQNWRDRKSISVDESRKDAACNPSFGGRSKRHSTGDIQLVRQDSNEIGKHSAGGGFGLPKPSGQDDQTLTPSDELPLQELHEVQITEEESQGLKGWKLGEIKYDTGCRIFHNRDKCVIEIRGDPQQCKVAKSRVYSVIAAVQEEFGALVPLSDEVIEHLQTEGCNVLAERLALFSGASVKMINDTQLFISGHRTSVNLAKAQLAKIKVMLRYTDDPDVQSPSQQNINEEKYQLVEKLFSALEERPRRATDPGCTDQATMKEGLSRDFLLSCALSPVARQRPASLSLDRTEDWVKDIVLVNGRRGEQAVLDRKGFGLPTFDSRPPPS